MPKQLKKHYGDVADYETHLVMSGVESDAYWDLAVAAGFDRLLISFHYIQRKGKRWLKERMEKHPHVKLMVDSGAYTFHVNEEEYKNKPLSFFQDYVERYTEWVKENKQYIFSCVEVDIANIVGFDVVDGYRKNYFEPLKDLGVMVCYVWHDFDGKPHWEEMCKKYDYVGFSLGTGNHSEAEIMKMVNIARRHGALVHGFALTRVDIMSKIPFFTGDSTTWLVGTQYGELNWFDGRRMRRLKKKDWKTVYKQKYIKLGANWDLAGQENPYELIRINLLVFKQAEIYIRKRIRAKSYWLENRFGTAGSGNTMTKSLIKRSGGGKTIARPKAKAEEAEKPKKKLLIKKKIAKKVESPIIDNPIVDKPILPESDEGDRIQDRPKTKFELFEELSKGEEKIVLELDEQLDKLPTLEWFNGECDDYKDIYRKLGLSYDGMGKEDVLDILYNFRLFLIDTEILDEQDTDNLIEMAKFLLKSTPDGREDAVDQLAVFYAENLTGEREDFKQDDSMGHLEAPPRPTERESYLEEEEYEIVDVPEEEMNNLLPSPKDENDMPEVDEIDKELTKMGVIAVRDENGRFLKGQKKVRKPKQLYSKHFPKLACNTCYKAGECPEYKPDHACAYENIFKKFKTRNVDDLLDAMFAMSDLNMERMSRLALFETMDGGMPDPTLTSMIDQNLNIMMKMKQLHEAKAQIIATQRRTMASDGTMETTTSVTNPNGGILAQIFGMGNGAEDEDETNEDAPVRKDITPKE